MKVEQMIDGEFVEVFPQDETPDVFLRRVIGETIGEASMCWSETPSGVFDSERASTLVEKLLAAIEATGLNVRNELYEPDVRPEDVEKPAWFLEWLHGTFSPDIQELASRQAGLRHEVSEKLTTHRRELSQVIVEVTKRKLTKKAKLERKAREAEHQCGRDCDG